MTTARPCAFTSPSCMAPPRIWEILSLGLADRLVLLTTKITDPFVPIVAIHSFYSRNCMFPSHRNAHIKYLAAIVCRVSRDFSRGTATIKTIARMVARIICYATEVEALWCVEDGTSVTLKRRRQVIGNSREQMHRPPMTGSWTTAKRIQRGKCR